MVDGLHDAMQCDAIRRQKEGYDLFREDLLPGRGCMVNLLPVAKGGEEGQKVRHVILASSTNSKMGLKTGIAENGCTSKWIKRWT